MGARIVFVVILFNAVVRSKNILNHETVQSIDLENFENQKELSEVIPGKENIAQTLENVLFKPYTPEDEGYGVENIQTKPSEGLEVTNNSYGLTKPEDETQDVLNVQNSENLHKFDVINIESINKEPTDPIQSDNSDNIESKSKPSARYEITENVIDIPDDRTPAGPIVPNYTPYRNTPLNLGAPKNQTDAKKNEREEKGDEDRENNNNRSRISILHINAEYDDKPDENQSKITTFFKGVKRYISGIKTDVVNGINKLFKKDDTLKSKEIDFSKEFDESHESDDYSEEEDDDDDFTELHHSFHKGSKLFSI